MKPIYVDLGDEITTVIERLKAAPENSVALVVPKGAPLVQSIVNLKLAKRAAQESGKQLVLVTTDKIGRNLAAQVGLTAVTTLEQADESEAASTPSVDGTSGEPEIPIVIDGVKVSRYYDETPVTGTEPLPEQTGGPLAEEPIIPREILRETTAPEPQITVRPIRQQPVESPVTIPELSPLPLVEAVPVPSPAIEILPAEEPALALVPVTSTTETPALSALPMDTPRTPSKRFRKAVPLLVLLLVLCVLGAAGASAFYLPKTSVTVIVPAADWQQSTQVSAAAGSPQAAFVIVTSDDSVPFKATGTKELGEKAKGSAKIFNSDSSDPKEIPAGTVLTANGRLFATTEAVTVPGVRVENGQLMPGASTVQIDASDPGPESNLSSVTASVTGQKVYSQIVSTTGGTSKQVAVITATDIANAKAALQTKARETVDAKIVAALQDQDTLFDPKGDIFGFENFSTSVAVGAESASGTAAAKASLKRLVVHKKAVLDAAAATLKAAQEADTTYQTDTAVITGSTISTKDGAATVTVDSRGRKAATIPKANLAEQLVGKTDQAGETIIKTTVRTGKVTVSRAPGWWPIHSFPYSSKYITVDVKYE